jgi:glycosyltransferase involved in cell wall biosynthesis
MASQSKQQIAVVIISKDEPSLAETIRLLKPQCESLGARLVIVDASLGKLDWIRKENPWVIWHDYVKSLGKTFTIPQQRNLGVKLADADVIAYCDSGSLPAENWLQELTDPIIKKAYRVTCGPIEAQTGAIYSVVNDVPTGSVVSVILTANLAFEKSAFDEAGGFNEAYDYGSDADFALRLLDAGISPISIQTARVQMDWGQWSLQKKRSWRYGRARSRLLFFHRDRTIEILKTAPVLFVYPPLAILAAASLVSMLFLNFVPLLVLVLVFIALLWRNRKLRSPALVLVSHFIYSGGMIFEFLSELIKKTPTVVFSSSVENPYQFRLIEELRKQDVLIDFAKPPSKSATLNLFLWPWRIFSLAVGGTRIFHLHWTHEFVPHWLSNWPGRALAKTWFFFTLDFMKVFGIRLVYTAHNLTPHEKLFNNDAAVVRKILDRSSAVIVHQKSNEQPLLEINPNIRLFTVPEGIDCIEEPVKKLGSKDLVLVMLGSIRRYKGITELLAQLAASPPPTSNLIKIKIFGECTDSRLAMEVTELASSAQLQGWDVELKLEFLATEDMQNLFANSDAALFAFNKITNSGSVMMALGRGVPVIVPDLSALSYLTKDVAILYKPEEVVELLSKLTKQKLEPMRANALNFAKQYSWPENAKSHLEIYRDVLSLEKK